MSNSNVGFNVKSFIKDGGECKDYGLVTVDTTVPINNTKSGKKSNKLKVQKEGTQLAVGDTIVNGQTTSLSYIQSNIPYADAYNETMSQLDESINQLNILGAELIGDLQAIRNSRNIKGKYTYINDMTSTATNILSSKINAIREKNKTISDINKMELSRVKELKSQANEQDDNARIASLYDAFVNTPIGGGPSMLGPSMQDMMMNGSTLPKMALGGNTEQQQWEQNLNPAQARMVLEAKGAMDTVVVYDAATGNRYYDVIDKATGQSIPGVEKPSENTIYELDINQRGGFAKDINRNVVYPLIIINGSMDNTMNEY